MNPIFSSQEINKNENNYLDSLKHNYSLLNKKIKHFQENIFIYQPYFLPEHQIYIPIPVYKQTEKKYGRRKKGEIILKKPNHSKYSFDNIMRKIKVYYHNYIINFINDYIKKIYHNFQRFRLRKISGKVTQNVTRKYNQYIAQRTLKEFLGNEISKKYKYDKDKNQQNIDKLYGLKKEFEEILNCSYIHFYTNFFLNRNKEELEIKYGLSKDIKNFYDFIDMLKDKSTTYEDVLYCKEVENIGLNKFIDFLLGNDLLNQHSKKNQKSKYMFKLTLDEEEEIKDEEIKEEELNSKSILSTDLL